MSFRTPRWWIITQAVSILGLGFMAFFLVRQTPTPHNPHPYIAKRLFVEEPNDVLVNFTDLRTQLRAYIGESSLKIGLYFEYLPTGVNINVNANEEFFRASLVKLPVVMRTYKFIEEGRMSIDDRLTIEEKQLDSNFGDLWKRGAGTQLTVRELIKLILDESDNTAFNVLYEKVNVQLRGDTPTGDTSSDDIYDYLDIPREAEGITPMITPKNYTSILKSLYFSAYLSYAHSNEILRTMTDTHAQQWLRAGVRNGIPVANKIGRYDVEPAYLNVFSDCGIVYYPNRAYSLCVMVPTADADVAIPHIQHISKLVFDFVSRQP